MKILAITGALRKESYNTQLLRAVKEMAPEDMEIEIVTLHGIPLYDGDEEDKHGVPQSVKALQEKVRQADGIIIATPGRLIDHLEQNRLRLNEVKILVLDEADRIVIELGREIFTARKVAPASW